MKSVGVAKKSTSGSTVIEFKNLRLNDEDFKIGDVVMIKECNDDTCYGTLVRIWKDKEKSDPYARIRWFYKPANIFNQNYDFISQAELFDSDHEQDIWVLSLYGKVKILGFEEYHKLDEVDEDTFFTRARYFHREQVIRPGFEEWKRTCTCNSIVNPDCLYVACDDCGEFYHPDCIGYVIGEDKPWSCNKCS